VRRTADKARQRIIAWWTHFGEWSRILADPDEAVAVARALADDGMREVAVDVLNHIDDENAQAEALRESLVDEEALDARLDDPERRYSYWFAEAQREEASLEVPDDDAALARALTSSDAAACERALQLVSRHGRTSLRLEVQALRDAPGTIGWGARRVMRRMGWR
jgi:hypothetical protein